MRRSRAISVSLSLLATSALVLGFSATAASAATTVNYVALGDSYSAGLGADSYDSASGNCHRSSASYSALWAAAHAPTSYTFVACAGATTADVASSQLPALSPATTLVSLSVGGNDMGFGTIMSSCVLGSTTDCVNTVAQAEVEAQTVLPGLLDTLYGRIRAAAPQARVVVLGYPVFYQLGTFCVGLSGDARAKLDEGINVLDTVIGAAAGRAGFRFGDVRSAFVGNQLCGYGGKWLHALNLFDLSESYHPTAAGQSGGYLPTFTSAAA
jgi:lysophospholipase L1-like esterase